MMGRARMLNAAGYPALTIDLQANGESPGQVTTEGYRESLDARAAVAWLRRRPGVRRVAIIGFSLGGAAALLGPDGPVAADALVLEAVYPTIEEAIAIFHPKALDIFSTCPVGLIGDDVHAVAREMEAKYPDVNIFAFSCE